MKAINSPFIVRCFSSFQDKRNVYFVLVCIELLAIVFPANSSDAPIFFLLSLSFSFFQELLVGGELFDHLGDQPGFRFNATTVRGFLFYFFLFVYGVC